MSGDPPPDVASSVMIPAPSATITIPIPSKIRRAIASPPKKQITTEDTEITEKDLFSSVDAVRSVVKLYAYCAV